MLQMPYQSTTHVAASAWRSFLVLTGFIMIGMVAGNLISSAIAFFILSKTTDSPVESLRLLFITPEQVPDGWELLMLLQGLTHISTYLIPALVFVRWILRKNISWFTFRTAPAPSAWIISALLALSVIPLNSRIIEWNKNMKLPEFLSGLESWMLQQELRLGKLTEFLVSFTDVPHLIVALFVIAIVAAVGEEILFRGIIQRIFMRTWTNPHLAIWIAAIIFSTIHFQFYGFLPRVLLGALFGYIYYWTGNISFAILAHFVNNAFTVSLYYLYNTGYIKENVNEMEAASWSMCVLSVIVTGILIYTLRGGRNLKTEPIEQKNFKNIRD